MTKDKTFKFPAGLKNSEGFDTLHKALKDGQRRPFIGVTQGGSSRTKGARVAATTADAKPERYQNG
jgi:hypothetical protein